MSAYHLDNPISGPTNGKHRFVEGSSSVLRALQRVIERVANTDLPVLIIGEPGSGKRSVAWELHRQSEFAGGGFHEFAAAEFAQKMLHANNNGGLHGVGMTNGVAGTIFIHEIGDLAPEAQAALVECLGDGQPGSRRWGTRLIASSSRDLDPRAAGDFRPDLYYVISGVCLRVPALRHRKEDIPGLMNHFVEHYCALLDAPRPPIGEPLERLLREHNWPRNVQELEEAVRAVVAIGDERIALSALRSAMQQGARKDMTIAPPAISLKDAGRAASRRAERELILQVLTRTRWNRKRAAEELRISYKALLYKLKQIGVDEDGASSREYFL